MTIFRKDYQKPTFELPKTKLTFVLHPTQTKVFAELYFQNCQLNQPIFLNGVQLKLISINLDEYEQNSKGLSFMPPAKDFVLKTEVQINPKENTQLMGLYIASGLFTTQNEAEGFRYITFYPDHPDVMSQYTCTIVADKKDYPVRLSNGNIIFEDDHQITFEDPFAKPCYLFALVAGKLDILQDSYTTKNNKKVDLYLYCEEGKKERLTFAMEALKRAMRWDEDVFGLEYDLNRFSIVAVSHFNFGAMENKSLNIFNNNVLLANPMTTTDWAYQGIDATIAHEYFHNYSGDRVTLKNWFHLSLKESLTVYRHTEYAHDVYGVCQRIDDVATLKQIQYPEDDGPLAHPIMLEQAESVDNFYTATIYEKGAEVIRMMREVVGRDNFMSGCRLYFSRHDGQAVEIEDFVRAIEDASRMDLSQFMLWYQVPGRPIINIQTHYENNTFTVHMEQSHPRTKQPLMIPLAYGLVAKDGTDLLNGTLILDETEKTFTFDVIEEPVLSINRCFSAIADININYTLAQREHLIQFDADLFNRYQVMHQYMLDSILNILKSDTPASDDTLIKMMGGCLKAPIDNMLKSWMLKLPSDAEIINNLKHVNPEQLQSVRHLIRQHFADTYQDDIFDLYNQMSDNNEYQITPDQMGKRALKNVLLGYLSLTNQSDSAWQQYNQANNFTDLTEALICLVHYHHPKANEALDDFYARYENDALPFNRWFVVQASDPVAETVGVIKRLMNHPKFDIKNPNKVRALLGVFCNNTIAFQTRAGYDLIIDVIQQLDGLNPHMAATLAKNFKNSAKMPADLKHYAQKLLTRLRETAKLSDATREIVGKILDA